MKHRVFTVTGAAITAMIGGSVAFASSNLTATPTIKAACEALQVEACTIQSLQLRPDGMDGYRLDLVIEGRDRSLELWPHDIRGVDYQLIVQEEDGSFTNDVPGPVNTYRGIDIADAAVRLAVGIEEDGFRLRLIDSDNRQWFAEPLIDRVAGANAFTYAVYEGEAIISPENNCPVDETWRVIDSSTTSHDQRIGTPRGILAAEMAVDADFEFYQLYGSVSAVENRVNSVINSVNLQYESQCSLTHEMQTIVVRTNSSDPYSGDIESRLEQLRADWNGNNHPGINRDIVHLFTGHSSGGTIGLAYLGAVCTSFEYGVVESSCCGSFGCATDLSAHEMGHN
ncbi:MAG: M12 family metallo-peptidase, partial [Phycisphaerales bacterium]|nr:M12 family metallo-peptidase [Phycisphaerales bacterium]